MTVIDGNTLGGVTREPLSATLLDTAGQGVAIATPPEFG